MTKPYPKSNRFTRNLCFVLLTLTGIIYGCRKDILKDTSDTSVNSTAINQARSWYEKTYPRNKNITAPKSLSANSTATGVDLSQLIKPDWQRPESYNRQNREVIEIPIDPADKFSAGLTNLSKTYNKAYSRTSFLILKNGSEYEAYVMTIMADSAYVRNDLSKLAHNTYRSHDADFSGVVAYFTPKGKFVGSYGYKNGKLLPPAGSTTAAIGAQKTQNKKTIVVEQDPLTTVCVYWYMGYYEDGVLVYMEYLYKECYGGGGDSGGTSPAQPPPCIPASTSATHPAINADLDPIGSDPGPGDGGFPSPLTPIMINCEVVVPPTITNKVKDPCLKAMVDAAINKDVKFNITESMNSIFNQNTDFNIDFTDASPQSFTNPNVDGDTGVDNVQSRVIKEPDGSERKVIDFMNLSIRLNSNLSNASKEYITATIIHEALHAYLSYSQTIVNQHLDMARNYLNSMATQLQTMYPNLSSSDANALAWGGLENEAGTLYSSLSSVEKNNISSTNTAYKNGTNGQPCTP